ncbi:hypothetical protein ACJMK2_031716 [Sinanodonta woodiana]|uniref:Uncharacterized protein n=1 Tax=Sinanodonta woodiana TaxID=1069815 RepID=A0ABD3X3L0_SINWO
MLYKYNIFAIQLSRFNLSTTDILDAVAGEEFIIRTWSLNYASISISVKREHTTLLNAFLNGGEDRDSTTQGGRLLLKYDHTIKEVSLMFQNVSRVDEGLYEFDESFYRIKPLAHELENEGFERQDGRWNLQFNVHEAGEIKRVHVGGKISMEFPTSLLLSYLYHYEEMVTIWIDSVCNHVPDTHYFGRIRCTGDAYNKVLSIVIDNITQADTGLYMVFTYVGDSWRWFLNITDNTYVAYIGGNVTIGWFYSCQVMNRTIRIIHPQMGAMMLLTQDNVPQVRGNLKHRVKYTGDVTKCYIAFTLLHVESSDAGLYTIETKQGNTIPGRIQLSVEEAHTSIDKSSSIGYQHSSTITISLPIKTKPSQHHQNIHTFERRHSREQCNTNLYLTPIKGERPLSIPPPEEGGMSNCYATENEQPNSGIQFLYETAHVCINEYETVNVSSHEDRPQFSHDENINYETPENIKETCHDTFGYLTVLDGKETTVSN